MMRFGRLLAEGHPDTLLEEYGRTTLEDVFLRLCVGDDEEAVKREVEKVSQSPKLGQEGS